MADVDQITSLREMIGEPDDDTALFAEDRLVVWIDAASGNLNLAALRGWQAKMAQYSGLVNVTDGAASRSFSDLLANARVMVNMYTGLVEGNTLGRTRIGKIVRDE